MFVSVKKILTEDGPSVEPSGPDALAEFLGEFEERLRGQGVEVDKYLAPGVENSRVKAALAEIELSPPQELLAWFAWRNGLTAPDGESLRGNILPPFISPVSVEMAIKRFRVASIRPAELQWDFSSEWLKISSERFGVSVRCSGDASEAPVVRWVDIDHPVGSNDRSHQVVSLCTVVNWWNEALDLGVFRWLRDETRWEWDYSLMTEEQRQFGFV